MKFEEKSYTIKLLSEEELISPLHLEYNQTVLRSLMLQIEAEAELYHVRTVAAAITTISKAKEGLKAKVGVLEEEEKPTEGASKKPADQTSWL